MTTSSEIRRAVVRAFYGQGLSYEEISNLLAIGEATVSRVLRLYRETGSVEPKPRGGGHYSPIRAEVAENLVHLIEEHPEIVEELKALIAEQKAERRTAPRAK